MKTMLSITAFIAAAAGLPNPHAAAQPIGTNASAALQWNQIALDAVARAKPTQHQAMRLLAHVSLAQYAALSGAGNDATTRDTVAAASLEVIKGLLPSQVDPSIKPLIAVPNHPSYPSNHSCVSTAAALALAHFFPQAHADLQAAAEEAGISRIYAGLHFRFDVEAGEDIGRKVAAIAIARYPQMLAKWSGRDALAQRAARQ